MKTLVTGAPGWAGTRLTEILREKGRGVRCLVLPEADESYLKSLGAEIFKGDLTDRQSLKGLCEGIATVFHCAGIIHPKKTKEFYRVNVAGTGNILDEAVSAGVDRFIYVSSNSAGGLNASRRELMVESDKPNPYKHYGMSKHKAEELVNEAFRQGRIKTVIVRPCWFYGIRQPERQTRFFKMIKRGDPIVFGDGKNLRSMTYVDNLVDALLLAEEKDAAAGKTYWIADKNPYSTIEIYNTISRLLGVEDFKPRFLPKAVSTCCAIADGIIQACGLYIKEIHVAGEMDKDIACSIEKAQKELGYVPKIGLEEGMRRSIEWCGDNGIEI